ncbi:MAG: amidohydrolase family protein [Eubacteriales bacterium]
MIIDFHTHTFPDFLAPKVIPKLEKGAYMYAFLDGTVRGLQKSMEESKVDVSVVLPVATNVSQVVTCNNGAKQMNDECSGSLISFGAMHPDFENYKEELRRIKDMGMLGIKLHPDYQRTKFNDIRYKRILETASELDLITLVHAGLDIGLPDPIHATPKMIKEVMTDVQPRKLVLAHMGGWQLWDDVMDQLVGEDVYIDTAFSLGRIHYYEDYPIEKHLQMMNEEAFMKVMECFGEDKVLFATDSPWGGQKETLEALEGLPLSQVQKRKILCENAKGLLGL